MPESSIGQLTKGAQVARTVYNLLVTDLLAGVPVFVQPNRADVMSVRLPGLGAPDLFNFEGVLERGLLGRQQSNAACVVKGPAFATVKVPSPASGGVVGASLRPMWNSTDGAFFEVVAYETGVKLREDITAKTADTILLGADGGALVEMMYDQRNGGLAQARWDAPLAIDADYYIAALATDAVGETITDFSGWLKTKPDYPRNMTITPGGTTTDVAAASFIVTGLLNGEVVSETFAFAANATAATVGVQAFDEITSVVVPAQDGAAATFAFGLGGVLGLNTNLAGQPTILSAAADGTEEGTAPTLVVDAGSVEKNTVAFNTALDGAVDFTLLLHLGV